MRPLKIQVFQPSLGRREVAAAKQAMVENWPGKGPRTAEFERRFAAHLGVAADTVFSVSTCTEGLFQSVQALGIGPDSDVVMPTIHFVGAANAVGAVGARLVFCDVDTRTLNPTLEHVMAAITPNTKAVMLLHYGGLPGEVAEIAAYCKRRGIYLIEDAAISVASQVDGQACGTFGDIGVWSFDSMKTLSCGDGGMVYCKDPEVAARMKAAITLGLLEPSGIASKAVTRWWEHSVGTFGRRAILNDVASAIGLVQLARLPGFLQQRAKVAARYRARFRSHRQIVLSPEEPERHRHSHSFFWIQLDPDARDALSVHLRELGIYTTFRYTPLHLIPLYGWGGAALPAAESASRSTLLLPQHQGLTLANVDLIADAVTAFLDRRRLVGNAAAAAK